MISIGNESEVTLSAIGNKEFMEVFNSLHLPLNQLPVIYKGYLIAQYLNSGVDNLSEEEYDRFIKTEGGVR
jgi:hypothetical protein